MVLGTEGCPTKDRGPPSETRGSTGETLLIYVMPQGRWMSNALVRKSEVVNRRAFLLLSSTAYTVTTRSQIRLLWTVYRRKKNWVWPTVNDWVERTEMNKCKALIPKWKHIKENLVNGCWGWLILFQIDLIFPHRAVILKCTRDGQADNLNEMK